MATVIGKRFNKTTNLNVVSDTYDWLITTLPTLFTFTKTVDVDSDATYSDFLVGKKLYVTDNTYLYLLKRGSGSSYYLYLLAGNDTAGPAYSSTSIVCSVNGSSAAYVEITKSTLGDILIKCNNQGSNVATYTTRDNTKYHVIAIAKCKNIVTNNETYGLVIFKTDAQHTVTLLVTDDTEGYDINVYDNYVKYLSDGTNKAAIIYGENEWAKITVLMPICSVSSVCVAVNAFATLFTPQFLWGNAQLDDKSYYFSDQFVMLDEAT